MAVTHNAPFVGTSSQVSPRIRLNLYPSSTTTLYGYYGRQFMPTNIEDLRPITAAAQQQANATIRLTPKARRKLVLAARSANQCPVTPVGSTVLVHVSPNAPISSRAIGSSM